MQELMTAKFIGHPELSHILNLHLRDNAVMKSTFNTFKAEMLSMSSQVTHAQSSADKAMTEARKK